MSKYLITEGYNAIKRLYSVAKETDKSYIVRINDRVTQIIPKRTMRTGTGYNVTFWKVATDSDIEEFIKVKYLNKIKNKLNISDVKEVSLDSLKEVYKLLGGEL